MEFSSSMFFRFIINHKVEQVKGYLDTDIDLDMKDIKGKTALYIACDHGDLDIVKLLLEKNVNIDCKNNIGWTALDIAIFRGRNDIISAIKQYMSKKELAKLEHLDLAM